MRDTEKLKSNNHARPESYDKNKYFERFLISLITVEEGSRELEDKLSIISHTEIQGRKTQNGTLQSSGTTEKTKQTNKKETNKGHLKNM